MFTGVAVAASCAAAGIATTNADMATHVLICFFMVFSFF